MGLGLISWITANASRAVSSLTGAERFALEQGGVDKFATISQVRTLPIYAAYASLPSVGVLAGQEALVNRLAGSGYFRVRYDLANARWNVVMGECIASQSDPLSVVSAGATGNTDLSWVTIPANIFGDGQEWEISAPAETAANTGNDTLGILIGGQVFFGSSISPSLMSAGLIRVSRVGSLLYRTLNMGTSITSSIVKPTIDLSAATVITLRIGIATIGNTTYIRRAQIRRLS